MPMSTDAKGTPPGNLDHGTPPDFFKNKTNEEVFDKAEYEGGIWEYIFSYAGIDCLNEPYRGAATLLLDILDTYEDWDYGRPLEDWDDDKEPLYGADEDA